MKIVCGTDFSTHASEAATVAAALATRLQGTLSLVHVMDANRYELPSKELMDYLCSSRLAKLRKEDCTANATLSLSRLTGAGRAGAFSGCSKDP